MKPFRLLAIMPVRPIEFIDRVAGIVDSRLEILQGKRVQYSTKPWNKVLREIEEILRTRVTGFLAEAPRLEIDTEIQKRISNLPKGAPFGLFHNGDSRLAWLCYLVVRLFRPRTVVETGVCYGVTSAFILQALKANGEGTLHSIDLPPLGKDADQFVGRLVPENLRNRWHLHRGISKRVLPSLLAEVGTVDVFVHDSLHTYRNMCCEFSLVKRSLSRPGVVISDDIEGNSAFHEWVTATQPSYWATIDEKIKRSILGLSIHLDPNSLGQRKEISSPFTQRDPRENLASS